MAMLGSISGVLMEGLDGDNTWHLKDYVASESDGFDRIDAVGSGRNHHCTSRARQRVDGGLNRGSIIGGAIAFGAKISDIDCRCRFGLAEPGQKRIRRFRPKHCRSDPMNA